MIDSDDDRGAKEESLVKGEIPLEGPRLVHRLKKPGARELLAKSGLVPKAPASTDEAIERNELSRIIEEAIGRLTERQAQVLRLRFFGGLTLKQAAEEMGLKTSERARQLEKKALNHLRHPRLRNLLAKRLH